MIIDGRIFYLIDVLYNLSTICTILLIASPFVIGFLLFMIDGACYEEEDKYKKCIKIIIIIDLVLMLILIFVPSKEAMYQMLVCKYITRENINLTIKEAKDLVDYIVSKIGEIK